MDSSHNMTNTKVRRLTPEERARRSAAQRERWQFKQKAIHDLIGRLRVLSTKLARVEAA